MPVTITRTAWIDDDGTGQTGTPINNAEKQLLYNQIDAALAQLMPLVGNGTLQGHLYFSPDNTYDLGQAANYRPRDVFVSRNVSVAGSLTVGQYLTLSGTLISNLNFTNDNANDIGQAANNRPRDIFVGRNLTVGADMSVRDVVASRDLIAGRNIQMPDRVGVFLLSGARFMHNYYNTGSDSNTNLFLGQNAGNFTMGPGGGSPALATKVIGIGANALMTNTTGGDNTAVGAWACQNNTTGNHLVALGTHALKVNTTGNQNTAIGVNALFNCLTGNDNTALGYTALQMVTSGSANVGCGENAGANLTNGNGNTCLGTNAGFTAGANVHGNVIIGCNAGYWETGGSKFMVDNTQRVNEADARAKALLYGIFDAAVANQQLTVNGALKVQGHITPVTASTYNLGSAALNFSAMWITAIVASGATPFNAPGVTNGTGTAAVFDASNNLIKQTSSRRFKTNIEPAQLSDDFIGRVLNVEPSWFDYRNAPAAGDHLGFIAEDLAVVRTKQGRSPLVNIDSDGEPDSVREAALLAVHHVALKDLLSRVALLEAQ